MKNSDNCYSNALSAAKQKHFIKNISSVRDQKKLLNEAIHKNNPELVGSILEHGKFNQLVESKSGRPKQYAVPKIVGGKSLIKGWTIEVIKIEQGAEKDKIVLEDNVVLGEYEDNVIVNKKMVKVMLDSGLTVNNFFDSSELLYSAVKNQDEEFVKYLVAKGAKGDEKFGAYNVKTFEHAVMSGNVKIVQAIAPVAGVPSTNTLICALTRSTPRATALKISL